MKVLLVALALLALAASAAATDTVGGCGCHTPHVPPPVHLPPPVHMPPPVHLPPPVYVPPPVHLPPPVYVPPPVHHLPPPSCHPHYPTVPLPPHQPPHSCPCHPTGSCGGVGGCVGSGTPPVVGQCIEFLRHQCSPAPTPYCTPQCQALRQQCCQQVRQVEPLHRFQVIYNDVLQAILPQQPGQVAGLMASQIAQQLMQMCAVVQYPYPPTSPCPSCSNDATTAAAAAAAAA